MNSQRQKCLGVFFGVFLVGMLALGCNSNSGGGTTNSFLPIQEVDLAIGDINVPLVAVYLDILSNTDTNPDTTNDPASPPTADVVFDNAGSGIIRPEIVLFDEADLYVADPGDDTVKIFRDYASATDGDPADIELDNATAGIDNPVELAIGADTLAVSIFDELTTGNDTIALFHGISSIAANQAPDAVLDNATSLVEDVNSLFITSDERLVVANRYLLAAAPYVMIFEGVSTLPSAAAPDVVLYEDTSFLGLGTAPRETLVDENDNLYVATFGNNHSQVFIFYNSSSLTTDALPDVVLYGQDSLIDSSHALAAVGDLDTLIVGNGNGGTGVCTAAPGIVGFYPVSLLESGQGATVHPPQETQKLGSIINHGLQTAGNALFAAGTQNTCGSIPPYSLYVFRNVGLLGLQDDSTPNLVISGDNSGVLSGIVSVFSFATNNLDAGT